MTQDDELGMAWWNALSERDRARWSREAGNTGRAKDAWEAFKRASVVSGKGKQMDSRFDRQLTALRERGWRVAVHNDYRIGGQDMTFWLMTHEIGVFLKGEGRTDMDALMDIDRQRREQQLP